MRWLLLLLLVSSCRVWTDRSLPDPIDLHEITFHKNEGWIVSYGTGQVFKTSNSGRSWKPVAKLDSLFFEEIQFLDSKQGWLVGERGTLLKTTDGGRQWEKLEVDADESHNLLFYSMFWHDSDQGWISGHVRKGTQIQNYIYTSVDGGFSWTKHAAPALFFNLVKTTDGTWWASATDKIYTSKNGTDWIESFSDSLKSCGQLRGLTIAGENNLLSTGFKGNLLSSTDAGYTWHVQKVSTNRLRQVQRLNDHSILLAGDKTTGANNVLISYDNGLSWNTLEIKSDVHRVVTHKSKVWLIGKKGLILSGKRNKILKNRTTK
jgi:photosystem II stability/assembly factor-like uncharacterized protein